MIEVSQGWRASMDKYLEERSIGAIKASGSALN